MKDSNTQNDFEGIMTVIQDKNGSRWICPKGVCGGEMIFTYKMATGYRHECDKCGFGAVILKEVFPHV